MNDLIYSGSDLCNSASVLTINTTNILAPSPSNSMSATPSSPPKRGRGRKRDETLPYNRARDVQRAFRARRAAHLEALEGRVQDLEEENQTLRAQLHLPPSARPPLGKGPTGRGPKTANELSSRSSYPLTPSLAACIPMDEASPLTTCTSNSNSPSPSSIASANQKLWPATWESPQSSQNVFPPTDASESGYSTSNRSLLGLEHSPEHHQSQQSSFPSYHPSISPSGIPGPSHPHVSHSSSSLPATQDATASLVNAINQPQSQTSSPSYGLRAVNDPGEQAGYGTEEGFSGTPASGRTHSYSYPPSTGTQPDPFYPSNPQQQHVRVETAGLGGYFPKREYHEQPINFTGPGTENGYYHLTRQYQAADARDLYLANPIGSTVARSHATSHNCLPGGPAVYSRPLHHHHYSTG